MSIPRSFFSIKRTEQSKGHKENRRTEDAWGNSSVQLQKLKLELELQLELVLALQTPVAAPYGIDNLPSFPMRLEQWNIYEPVSLSLSSLSSLYVMETINRLLYL